MHWNFKFYYNIFSEKLSIWNLLRFFLKLILTLGRSSKKGPIQSKTLNKMLQEIKLASWVRPPTVCWINDLDNDAHEGMQEKNEPTRFPRP